MKIVVILAHPSEKSFNHAIADTVVKTLRENNHEVLFHDLYKEKFDPMLRREEAAKNAWIGPVIEKHCKELTASNGLVIIHPNWWGQPPAILKGWIDRVFRAGVAYEFREGDKGEGIPLGLLKGKTALVFNTSNTPDEREQKVFGDPLETIWKNCIFGLCGMTRYHRKTFNVILTSTPEQRKEWLQETEKIVIEYF
ncbi:MAG: NAD(P)H-dependent oxidoreductase [bacterium]|nr:NAD(P)H-dependent oxidoreductase [bacterium]